MKEESGVDLAAMVVDHDYPGEPFPVLHACGHGCHTAAVPAAAKALC